jgi:ribose 5-phosphate isomerase RpiB
VVFVHGKKFDVPSLVKALADGGIAVEPQQSDCIIASTDQLAQRLAGGGTLGVLLTRHTAAGVCLANRHPGVRAIVGRDLESAAADAASVGANLLIVDPTRNGTYRTRQIIGQFYRQGPQQCPKVFENQLK